MNLQFIGTIAKTKPWLARTAAISFYGALLSGLAYVGQSLQSGDWSDYQVALGAFITVFVTGVLEGLQKHIRDKKEKLESVNNK